MGLVFDLSSTLTKLIDECKKTSSGKKTATVNLITGYKTVLTSWEYFKEIYDSLLNAAQKGLLIEKYARMICAGVTEKIKQIQNFNEPVKGSMNKISEKQFGTDRYKIGNRDGLDTPCNVFKFNDPEKECAALNETAINNALAGIDNFITALGDYIDDQRGDEKGTARIASSGAKDDLESALAGQDPTCFNLYKTYTGQKTSMKDFIGPGVSNDEVVGKTKEALRLDIEKELHLANASDGLGSVFDFADPDGGLWASVVDYDAIVSLPEASSGSKTKLIDALKSKVENELLTKANEKMRNWSQPAAAHYSQMALSTDMKLPSGCGLAESISSEIFKSLMINELYAGYNSMESLKNAVAAVGENFANLETQNAKINDEVQEATNALKQFIAELDNADSDIPAPLRKSIKAVVETDLYGAKSKDSIAFFSNTVKTMVTSYFER